MRQQAIHFWPEVDRDDRELALSAIRCMQEIIEKQFSAFGRAPWVLVVPGEVYIKKEWEQHPFVREVFLPNCLLVGPQHTVEAVIPRFVINDDYEYLDRVITDEEFCKLRIASP